MEATDRKAAEMLDLAISIIAEVESDAAMFPQENSAEISVSDFLREMAARAPTHLRSAVRAAIEKAAANAPRHVFVPSWMREGRF